MDDVAKPMLGPDKRESFDVATGSSSSAPPSRPAPAPAIQIPGMEPPAPPSASSVFKVMVRKHFFLAKKRKRILMCVWPVVLYGGVCAGMNTVFDSIAEDGKEQSLKIKAILSAILVPLWMTLAVAGLMQAAMVDIVAEKESKMKIIQQIYGLSPGMYWCSWAGYFFGVSFVCVIIIFILLYAVQPVMINANPLLVFIIFMAAYFQQFEITAIFSVVFNTMQSAATTASLINMLLTFLAVGAQVWLNGKSQIIWYLASLLPGINVFNGISAIMWTEGLYTCKEDGTCTQGLSFASMFATDFCLTDEFPCPPGFSYKIFSAGTSILMLVVDVILYGLFAWWLENVWQGEYGKAKPLTFCLDPAFVCPRRQAREVEARRAEASDNRVAMSITHLRKEFGSKVAVDDMSFDVFSGEIFALLGHNGAGKTTAINCIVGLIPPSSGGAVVNGYDIHTNIQGARRQLSICPQDNPFYDVFTVRQHLVFFANLRGVPEDVIQASISRVLSALGMPEKVDALCTTLSGGQKRRLWVATALIGQSPIMFLDEPTSGMDPSSRRELWDLFIEMKRSGRCIMFTTHYLEEADVLADRKAVMARGKIQAVGTSRELKMHYGLGYHLKVEMKNGVSDQQFAALSELVLRYVKSGKEDSSFCLERAQAIDALHVMKYTLPFNEVDQFGPLLLDLESKADALMVDDFSIAMTSLEEVFMALGRQAEDDAGDQRNADFREVDAEASLENPRVESSFLRSVTAIMRIRLLNIQSKKLLYPAFFAPILMLVLAFAVKVGGSDGGQSFTYIAVYPAMAFGIAMIPHSGFLIKDRELKIKHVALAQGLGVRAYWFGSFAASYLCVVGLCHVLIGLINFLQTPGLVGDFLPMLVIEVFIYPMEVILMAYSISLLFTNMEMAMKVLPLMNMLAGAVPVLIISQLWLLPDGDGKTDYWNGVAKFLHVIMSLINPIYSMPGMLVVAGMEKNQMDHPTVPQSEEPGCCDSVSAYFHSWASVPLWCAPVTIFLYAATLVWKDSRSYYTTPGDHVQHSNTRKDADVLAEEARIASASLSDSTEAAVYHNLSHTYRSLDASQKCSRCKPMVETHAVRGISLGIHRGECFGLLGPNGAGKTTTLDILTGVVNPPTAGSVSIFGKDMSTRAGMKAAYDLLGLCPQVDPLWELLSGREHLLFYGRVKGVPEAELSEKVKALLFRLGFDDADADKTTEKYSGGMKRKLSVGIALIGQSPLLFLDEPSAAVDAGAKRHLWKVIKRRAASQTVVLTTHSMEEAEALCDRIAIQVKGQLRCLGTPSHIKNTYGSGYQLEIFCSTVGNVREMTTFLQRKLSPKVTLIEQHAGHYMYQLPPMGSGSELSLGKVFSEMQANMQDAGIVDYSLAQPSLEQVFIRFAREQEQEDEPVAAVVA